MKRIIEKYHYYHNTIPNIVYKNQRYLIPGIYRIYKFGELVINENIKSHLGDNFWGIKSLNWRKKIIRLLMVKLFSKKIILLREEKFSGQALKYSEDHVIKIFDFKTKVVLTVLPTDEMTSKMISNHEYFSKYFNTTHVKRLESNVLTEDYIVSDLIEPSHKFNLLLNCYDVYFKELVASSLIHVDYQIVEVDYINRSSETVLVRCHGDCWSSNILYSNESLYMIDFDRNGQWFFLYDLLTYMYCETVFNHDSTILNYFTKGSYDYYILNFYKTFGLVWDGSKKILINQFSQTYYKEHLSLSHLIERTAFKDFIDQVLSKL